MLAKLRLPPPSIFTIARFPVAEMFTRHGGRATNDRRDGDLSDLGPRVPIFRGIIRLTRWKISSPWNTVPAILPNK